VIKGLIVMGSIIMLTSCSQSNEQVWEFSFKTDVTKTLENSCPKPALPPSNQYCTVIEYLNQSLTNKLSITSIYTNSFIIEKNKMKDVNANLLNETVEKLCKNISNIKQLKFGFEYDAERKACMCAYGEKK
jgi:hypothetical protein